MAGLKRGVWVRQRPSVCLITILTSIDNLELIVFGGAVVYHFRQPIV